jgi:hypothetical protein
VDESNSFWCSWCEGRLLFHNALNDKVTSLLYFAFQSYGLCISKEMQSIYVCLCEIDRQVKSSVYVSILLAKNSQVEASFEDSKKLQDSWTWQKSFPGHVRSWSVDVLKNACKVLRDTFNYVSYCVRDKIISTWLDILRLGFFWTCSQWGMKFLLLAVVFC